MSEQPRLIAGRYRLEELLGRGGMGDVYRGTDVLTGEPVAVKRLHEYILAESPQLIDRFQREAEALRQLAHPNIVTILDTIDEGNNHYLVMEYVSGGSLRELIDREERLPVEMVLNAALDLADALARAHRLNIIHRDIKPDNVLVAKDGTPRLTDFGVAHLGDRTRLTATGSVIGTYAYLSPEACNGLELDERTDIWSFGVLLYEALAGRLPFDETSTAAMLTAILNKPAPDLGRFRDDLPDALIDLISRMLEKDRDRRVSSVRLVGAELEALIRGMDTPLRALVMGLDSEGRSRFATPPDQDSSSNIPAMVRSTPGQTHGLTVYPTPSGPQADSSLLVTPGGTPITGEYPPSAAKWRWITLMVVVLILSVAGVATVAILVGSGWPNDGGGEDSVDSQDHGIVSDLATAAAALAAVQAAGSWEPEATHTPRLTVEPVEPGEYMVLVAQMENLDGIAQLSGVGQNSDVTRFIVDDLHRDLEEGMPLSNVRIRRYMGIVTSDEEAQAAAESAGAAVVVWGNYTQDLIEVKIQLGVITAFPYIPFERDLLERTTNITVHMIDERRESVAPYVLNMLNVLHVADGNAFEAMRSSVLLATLEVQPAELVGSGVAVRVNRFLMDQSGENLEQLDAALELDPANALLYTYRALLNQQHGLFEDAAHDIQTALRLSDAAWAMPIMLQTYITDDETVLDLFTQVIELRPDDWFPLFFRGAIYYQFGQYDLAQADFQRAIDLDPKANFPYVFGAILALREGRLTEAGQYVQVILTRFPDPNFMDRLIRATFNEDQPGPVGYILSAFTELALGQYESAIETATNGLADYPGVTDLLFMLAVSQCALGENEQADAVFSFLLAEEPGLAVVRLLRGVVRMAAGDTEGAEAGWSAVVTGEQGESLVPYVEMARAGELTCSNFFSVADTLRSAEGR